MNLNFLTSCGEINNDVFSYLKSSLEKKNLKLHKRFLDESLLIK